MKEVKTSSQKSSIKLPPQKSANDTSNWDNRNVSAPTLDKITKKRVVRDIEFIENKPKPIGLTLAQVKKLEAQKRTKKTSK
ncbi:MAG: hypothetical protein ABIR46_03210 [Candidatus Saccharimonadales bacterium]